jgi:hypothetical protein
MIAHTTTFVSIYAISEYKWLHDYVVYKTVTYAISCKHGNCPKCHLVDPNVLKMY